MPEVTPDLRPPPDTFELAYAQGSRTRRRKLRAVCTAGLVAVALLVGSVVAHLPRSHDSGGRQEVITQPTPTPTARPAPVVTPTGPVVTYEGVGYALPPGWKQTQLICYAADHTVAVRSLGFEPSCPLAAPERLRATAVIIGSLFGKQGGGFAEGSRLSWKGQPAYLSQATQGGETSYTLALPWLNALVTAESPDPATARALLDRVSLRVRPGLDLPHGVDTIFIQSLAGRDGDGLDRSAVIRAKTDVQALLDDLQMLAPVAASAVACSNDAKPQMAVITVAGLTTRSYLARFSGCGQLVGNTGHAFATDQRLLADLRRLVPDSGL